MNLHSFFIPTLNGGVFVFSSPVRLRLTPPPRSSHHIEKEQVTTVSLNRGIGLLSSDLEECQHEKRNQTTIRLPRKSPWKN